VKVLGANKINYFISSHLSITQEKKEFHGDYVMVKKMDDIHLTVIVSMDTLPKVLL